ncbi:MAG: enoyl-CoA hydratase/isomerase family protein [Defluviimonas sp.]|nr:enoyl-CoA hydratase/isomerase family protein [Defluviimonas sp.]
MTDFKLQSDGPVTRITIDRLAKSNALSSDMMEEIAGIVRGIGGAPGEKALVIDAAGDRGFSAGADISELRAGREGLERQEEVILGLSEAIETCPALIVTVLHGYAKGGGTIFPCLSDIVIARADVSVSFPEIQFRMYPFLLHALLTRRIPHSLAWQLCATGRALGADEAFGLGLVTEVLPMEGFRERAEERVRHYLDIRASLALGLEFTANAASLPFAGQMKLAGGMMHRNFAAPGVDEAIERHRARLASKARPS